MKNLAQELKVFRINQGLSQSEMAKKLNMPQTTWSGYERGRSNPTMGVLIELEKLGFKPPFKTAFEAAAEKAGLTLEEAKEQMDMLSYLPPEMDLAEGGKCIQKIRNGEYTVFKYSKSVPMPIPADKNDSAALVMLPLYSQKASAGPGSEPTQLGEIDSYIPIVLNLLKGINPAHCGIVEVTGDSMTDVGLYSGDYAIFNRHQTDGDGIYVITINGVTRIKRLENRPIEKKIIISSENTKRYPTPEVLSYEQATEMLIIHGKVIGWMHRHFY